MIYDEATSVTLKSGEVTKLVWSPSHQITADESLKRIDCFGLTQACRQTRSEFLKTYYQEAVFEIRLCDISKFDMFLARCKLPAPKTLEVSFAGKNHWKKHVNDSGTTIITRSRVVGADILPLMYFKYRHPGTELRFTWFEKLSIRDEMNKIFSSFSDDLRDILKRKALSQVLYRDGSLHMVFYLTK